MFLEVEAGVAIDTQNQTDFELTPSDQAWLASFGVDPTWQNDPGLIDELSRAIATGSRRLDEPENQTVDAHSAIMVARGRFMEFVGIADETIATFRAEHPTIIPIDTFINSQRVMSALGLDAAKVINAFPVAIGYAPESVIAKFDNLTALGLDAAKVINAFPVAIGYAPESVRAKVKFLDRSARLLQWEYSAKELIETYPAVLGFNKQKLRILRRAAAYNIDKSSRSAEPKQVRGSLIIPLEKYILALSNQRHDNSPQTLSGLSNKASKYRLDTRERREKALVVAPNLGRIGSMYLRYRYH